MSRDFLLGKQRFQIIFLKKWMLLGFSLMLLNQYKVILCLRIKLAGFFLNWHIFDPTKRYKKDNVPSVYYTI